MGANSNAPWLRRARSILTVVILAAGALIWAAGPSAALPVCPIPGNFEIDGDMLQATCTPAGDDWNTPGIGVQSTTQGGTYSTAGKDDGNPSTWVSSGSTPDKTNFERAYATSRVVGGHFYVFVAWERTSTSGTQGYAIEIDNSNTNVGADGTPQPNRASGGAVFYISSQGSSPPTFDSACSFTSQSNYGTTCTNSNASVTSAINTTSISDPLAGTTQAAGSFFEVALDVTALTGIVPSCPGASAASVYLRSITGQTHNGNLKGYMAPLSVAPNSTCVAPPITTTANPGGAENAIGSTQNDSVTVGTAQAPGVGSVKFILCPPAVVTANGGDCSANGTLVSTNTLNASGQATSGSVTGATTPSTNAIGKYCWRAEFTPSANDHNYLAGSHTNSTTECFTVVRNTTLIGTAASSQTVGAAIHDVATLSGATANAGGTITFNAYGPSDTADCSGSTVFTSTVNVSGNGNYNSGDFTPGTAGKYYWVASYSGDGNNLGSSGSCGDAGETSTVGKKTTLIGTAASSQIVGNAVHDVATLSGGLNPTGTITFQAWGPSDTPDCSGTALFTDTVTVTGNGDYTSGDFTPSTAGKYYWIATYSGDGNNIGSAGSCGDTGETSTIGKKTTLIATAASSETIGAAVHDVATLSGGLNPTGTIVFNLYGPSSNPDCSGSVVFTAAVTVNGNGDYNSGNFTPSTAGSYYWTASYSGDVNNLPSSDPCGAQGETSVLVKRTTGISTVATNATIGDAVHDVATLTGATANAGGSITFNLYGPSATPDCSGTAVYTHSVNVSGPGSYNSGDFTPSTAGNYYWVASYSGDVNNLPSSGSCGDTGETSVIGKQPTGIATSATSGTIGDAVHDVATLSGATANAGGTITFDAYGPSDTADCSGAVVYTKTVNVSGPGDYNSGDFTPLLAGSYYWIASYSGDVNNQPSSGSCGDVGETSTVLKRTTGIVTAATSGTIGDAVHDVATLSGATADAGGTIAFTVYGPGTSADCTGPVVYSDVVSVSGPGDYQSGDFTPLVAGSYYWIASYSGDDNNLPSAGTCGDANETSTLAKHPTSIVTTAVSGTIGDAISDTATLSGGTPDIGGSISFSLYGPSDTPDCSATAVFTSIVAVSGNGSYTSDPFTPDTAGPYYWVASYSGDVNNLPSTGTCGDEGETSGLGKAGTDITTRATSTSSVQIADVASLTGATAAATGTITFSLYGPSDTPDCTGDPVFTDTVDVAGPGNYKSGGFTPTAFGTYYWVAAYSGDVNNLPSEEPCGSANESSTFEAAGSSSSTPPPPTSPPSHGTSGTGAPVKGELELVALLLGAGLAMLLIGRRRRGARQH